MPPTNEPSKQSAPTPDTDSAIPVESPAPARRSLLGPVVGILIVVLVLILGGLYLWGSMLSREIEEYDATLPLEETPATTTAESTELDDLEAELEADFAGFEEDLDDIDAAFEGEADGSATGSAQ